MFLTKHLSMRSCSPSTNYNMVQQIRSLSSKVLFALSINNFGAVFSRISGRLQELSVSGGSGNDGIGGSGVSGMVMAGMGGGSDSHDGSSNSITTDIELIQHIDVNIGRLVKLLAEAVSKFKALKNVV